MKHIKKYYEWSIVYMTKSGNTETIKGSEGKESDAVKKIFAYLEDKSFAIHVLEIFVYAMPDNKSVISINPISRKVMRGMV